MRTLHLRPALLLLALLSTCSPPPCNAEVEDCPVVETPPPADYCDSAEQALADQTNCFLSAGQRKTDLFISTLVDGGVDKDWYVVDLPGDLNARSLLHVNAGYTAANTPVDFSVNVLQQVADGGFHSIASAVDNHGARAPTPVDIVMPFDQPNARLFVLVGHNQMGNQVRVDNKSAYTVLVETLPNPDGNEPNDMTPTPITLQAMAGSMDGMQSGYLATANDVDLYSFPVTQSGRQIIYLRIRGPNPHPTNPPPPYRLSYTLYDPMGVPISEGTAANNAVLIDLATARLATMTGTYQLRIAGYKPAGSTASVGGDPSVRYDVQVRVMPDIDMLEGPGGNDTKATARNVNLSPNTSQSITGKISSVPDEEWFHFTFPARSMPSVLRYRLTVANGGGRFEPLKGVANRQIRFMTEVTQGATAQDRRTACTTDPMVCPKGYRNSAQEMIMGPLVSAICGATDPPFCLNAQRNEHPRFANLKNMVGAVPIAANQSKDLYLQFRDEGQGQDKYADDRDWTLTLSWEDDPDEQRASPTNVTLGAATTDSQGVLSYGYGEVLRIDVNDGDGIRAPEDYDAQNDSDLFQFNFGGAMGDQAWALEWELNNPDGGMAPPGELAFELQFCPGGTCNDRDEALIFAYTDRMLTPWYLPNNVANTRVLVSRTTQPGATIFRVEPVACQCFSSARVGGGFFMANVTAVDRVSNDPIRYHVRQSIGAYPAGTCPASGAGSDAGCGW